MFYEYTDEQWSSYENAEDGIDAIQSLGVEPERFTKNGIRHDDGEIEKYEDFHVRVNHIHQSGGNHFEL